MHTRPLNVNIHSCRGLPSVCQHHFLSCGGIKNQIAPPRFIERRCTLRWRAHPISINFIHPFILCCCRLNLLYAYHTLYAEKRIDQRDSAYIYQRLRTSSCALLYSQSDISLLAFLILLLLLLLLLVLFLLLLLLLLLPLPLSFRYIPVEVRARRRGTPWMGGVWSPEYCTLYAPGNDYLFILRLDGLLGEFDGLITF